MNAFVSSLEAKKTLYFDRRLCEISMQIFSEGKPKLVQGLRVQVP